MGRWLQREVGGESVVYVWSNIPQSLPSNYSAIAQQLLSNYSAIAQQLLSNYSGITHISLVKGVAAKETADHLSSEVTTHNNVEMNSCGTTLQHRVHSSGQR